MAAPLAIFTSDVGSRLRLAWRSQCATTNGVSTNTSSELSDWNHVIGITMPADNVRSTPSPAQIATVLPICS